MLSTHSLSFSNCLILFLLVNSSSGFNPSAKISCLSCSSSSSFSCLNLASRACKALRFSYKSYIIPIYNLLVQTIWFIDRVECFWLITNKESHLFITHGQTCKALLPTNNNCYCNGKQITHPTLLASMLPLRHNMACILSSIFLRESSSSSASFWRTLQCIPEN